jgi:hypothetical protein
MRRLYEISKSDRINMKAKKRKKDKLGSSEKKGFNFHQFLESNLKALESYKNKKILLKRNATNVNPSKSDLRPDSKYRTTLSNPKRNLIIKNGGRITCTRLKDNLRDDKNRQSQQCLPNIVNLDAMLVAKAKHENSSNKIDEKYIKALTERIQKYNQFYRTCCNFTTHNEHLRKERVEANRKFLRSSSKKSSSLNKAKINTKPVLKTVYAKYSKNQRNHILTPARIKMPEKQTILDKMSTYFDKIALAPW